MAATYNATRRNFLPALSLGIALSWSLSACACFAGELPDKSLSPSSRGALAGGTEAKAPAVHGCPTGASILAVPAFTVGQYAAVSVVDAKGRPLPGVSVMVNGVPFDSNSQGVAAFKVPRAGALILSLRDCGQKEIARQDFCLLDDGLLVRPFAAPLINTILSAVSSSATPQLSFAPEVIAEGKTAVLLGCGFDGEAEASRVLVDGEEAEVLSASSGALLIRVPAGLAVGPVKEIVVATKSGASCPLETDVVRLQVSTSQQLRPGRQCQIEVGLAGSNLPAFVRLEDSGGVALTCPDGKPIAAGAILALPGGDHDAIVLKAMVGDKAIPPVFTLVPDAAELLADSDKKAPEMEAAERLVDYATIVKLKRRLLGVQARIVDAQRSAPVPGSTPAALEKHAAQARALGVREFALSRMLAARQAIYRGRSGTTAGIARALEDAAGDVCALDARSDRVRLVNAPLPVVPGAVQSSVPHPLALRPPRFKLWPPQASKTADAPAVAAAPKVAPSSYAEQAKGSQPAESDKKSKPAVDSKAAGDTKRTTTGVSKNTGKRPLHNASRQRHRHR